MDISVVFEDFKQEKKERLHLTHFVAFEIGCRIDEILKAPLLRGPSQADVRLESVGVNSRPFAVD